MSALPSRRRVSLFFCETRACSLYLYVSLRRWLLADRRALFRVARRHIRRLSISGRCAVGAGRVLGRPILHHVRNVTLLLL